MSALACGIKREGNGINNAGKMLYNRRAVFFQLEEQ